jgi:hypothetical protein
MKKGVEKEIRKLSFENFVEEFSRAMGPLYERPFGKSSLTLQAFSPAHADPKFCSVALYRRDGNENAWCTWDWKAQMDSRQHYSDEIMYTVYVEKMNKPVFIGGDASIFDYNKMFSMQSWDSALEILVKYMKREKIFEEYQKETSSDFRGFRSARTTGILEGKFLKIPHFSLRDTAEFVEWFNILKDSKSDISFSHFTESYPLAFTAIFKKKGKDSLMGECSFIVKYENESLSGNSESYSFQSWDDDDSGWEVQGNDLVRSYHLNPAYAVDNEEELNERIGKFLYHNGIAQEIERLQTTGRGQHVAGRTGILESASGRNRFGGLLPEDLVSYLDEVRETLHVGKRLSIAVERRDDSIGITVYKAYSTKWEDYNWYSIGEMKIRVTGFHDKKPECTIERQVIRRIENEDGRVWDHFPVQTTVLPKVFIDWMFDKTGVNEELERVRVEKRGTLTGKKTGILESAFMSPEKLLAEIEEYKEILKVGKSSLGIDFHVNTKGWDEEIILRVSKYTVKEGRKSGSWNPIGVLRSTPKDSPYVDGTMYLVQRKVATSETPISGKWKELKPMMLSWQSVSTYVFWLFKTTGVTEEVKRIKKEKRGTLAAKKTGILDNLFLGFEDFLRESRS